MATELAVPGDLRLKGSLAAVHEGVFQALFRHSSSLDKTPVLFWGRDECVYV